jgi:hypothetical protein
MGIRSLSSASISTGAKRSKFWDQSSYLIGDFDAIATTTLSSPAASITFGSGGTIPQGYKHLRVHMVGRTTHTTTDNNIYGWFNGDDGISNGNYHYGYYFGSVPTVGAASNVGAGTTAWTQNFMVVGRTTGGNSTSSTFGVAIWDIFDYSDSNKYKFGQSLMAQTQNGNATAYLLKMSSLWENNNPVTSIKLQTADGNFETGTVVTLFGIKG